LIFLAKLTFQLDSEDEPQSDVTEITHTERVVGPDSWKVDVGKLVEIAGLATMKLYRDGVELMQGFVDSPGSRYMGGSSSPLKGLGYDGNLRRYLTHTATITNVTAEELVDEILAESPSAHGITKGVVDTFPSLLQPPTEFTTAWQFALWTFVNTGIEFSEDEDYFETIDAGNPALPNSVYGCSFFNRVYKFYLYNDAGTIKYRTRDVDGTVTAEVSLGIATAGDFTVHLSDEKVYLWNDDGANTDFYRGTITGTTINIALVTGNTIVGSFIDGAAEFSNPNDKVFIFDGSDLYRSVDDGATMVNVDSVPANHTIMWLFVRAADDDLHVIVHDSVAEDIELWTYDDGTTTLAFSEKIDDLEFHLQVHGDQNANDSCHLVWEFAAGLGIAYSWWVEGGSPSAPAEKGKAATHHVMVVADKVADAWLLVNYGGGTEIIGLVEGAYTTETATSTVIAAGETIGGPCNHHSEEQVLVYFVATSGINMVDIQLSMNHIHLVEGETSGTFESPVQTASGSFTEWGILAVTGDVLADVTWDIEDNLSVDLLTGLVTDVDLDAAGLDPLETQIKMEGNFDQAGVPDPYITAVELSERSNKITSIPCDLENFESFLKKVARIVGAEFDLNTDDTLDFVLALGTDRSATITLEDGVNIENVTRDPDYRSFANVVTVLGAGTKGVDRVEVHIRDLDDIAIRGEFWAPAIRDQELTTAEMVYNKGVEAAAQRGTVLERISFDFIDTYDTGAFSRGDTINLKVKKWEMDQSVRLMVITRKWGSSGEKVSAEAINVLRATDVFTYLAALDDIRRSL